MSTKKQRGEKLTENRPGPRVTPPEVSHIKNHIKFIQFKTTKQTHCKYKLDQKVNTESKDRQTDLTQKVTTPEMGHLKIIGGLRR